ncbi:hemagglutinin repeat-containing protein [Paraburkholderia bonniea]|uniref:hemagglutinin repeat-containing protein n=1 Tax=Paraburkholderia bonniea TaxID=2152891 RepID=UPI002572A6E0|nr:hemagglutinin repeat-containing protein [Paraburkholderia bonniea]WJF95114.1 hemagglutinin repeat-containing protein [Paraburkholderia bonniea]
MKHSNKRLLFSRLRVGRAVVKAGTQATVQQMQQTQQARTGCYDATANVAGTSGAGHWPVTFALRPAALATLVLLGTLPVWSGAQIVPGGVYSPSVVQTQNGLPQVNLNRPSGAGVSLNTYGQFDVPRRGAILNNSPVVVQTQQAGLINGNPNFGPGQSARVIVNQVNSRAASQINGYLEVAGPRAEVVIANGSGISVNGGGFINTSRAILSTGTPNFAPDGSLAGFSVSRGHIRIEGAGLIAGATDQVDLITRAVQANAAIYAKKLNVITGANAVDHDTLGATAIAGDGPVPGVSIDVSQLGGMYANRIMLVGNEHGVGVSTQGELAAQAGELTLTTEGKLVLAGQANASGHLSLFAREGIEHSGTTYAQQNLSVKTSGTLTNSGMLAARQNTAIHAGNVASTGTLGAGVNSDGSLAHAGDLVILGNGTLSATGRNAAGGNAALNGAALNLADSRTSANGTLALRASGGDLNLSGATTTSGGALNLHAAGMLMNDNGALSPDGALAITAGALGNRNGQIRSGSTLEIATADGLQNQGGTLQAAGAFSINAGSLDNTGGHVAALGADALTLAIGGLLNNGTGDASGTDGTGRTTGTIGGNGNVTVQAGQIANAGSITAVQSLIAHAAQTLFSSGTLAANGNLDVTAGTTLTNRGTLSAGNLAALDATTIDNRHGNLSADQFTLHTVNLINHSGNLTQTGTGTTTLDVSGTLDNTSGTLQSNSDNFALNAAALVNDGGRLGSSGTGTLSVTTGTLSNNRGTLATNGALDIHADAVSNRGGKLAAQRHITLDTGSLDNRAGGYAGARNVALTSTGILNNIGGTIQADGTLSVTAQSVNNDGGTLSNSGTGIATVTASDALTNTANGLIGGNGNVSVSGNRISNANGTITAGGSAMLQSASTLDNRAGLIQGSGTVSVSAQDAIDNTGGQIEANAIAGDPASTLTLTATALDNTNGRIANTGSGTTSLSAATITNSNAGGVAGAGTIGGNGDVSVHADTLLNTSGAQLISGHDLTLEIAELADNTSATLSGANSVTLNGPHARLINAGGSIHGNGAITLSTATLDNTAGRIGNDQRASSGTSSASSTPNRTAHPDSGPVSIHTGTLANQNGAIGSEQDLAITANQLTGDGRIIAGNDGSITLNGDYTLTGHNPIQANHNLTFTTAGRLTNQGTLGAVNALTLNATNLDNQAGAHLNASTTTLNALNTITNAGRIEGDSVTTNSTSLLNTATIIGNTITLNASQYITSSGTAAAIAAASTVNLYTPGAISNTGGANLFSLGDINLAADSTRDTNGVLIHRTHSVTNDQSTIEAQGRIEIATQTLTNTRPAPSIETVTTAVTTSHQTKRDKYLACTTGNADRGHCTQAMWDNGYRHPLNETFSSTDVITKTSGPNAVDRTLVVQRNGQPLTIYYNTLTPNADGTLSVSYWDGYDPHINYDPGTEYASHNDAHKGYQRVEIARDTTTTTQQDRVTGPQTQQAQIIAGGKMVLANVGTLNNLHSAMAAGGSIQIGSADATGEVASGSYGGTLVNNTGQTLYQHQKQDIVSTYAWNENMARDRGPVVQPSVVLTPVAIGGTGGTIIASHAVKISATDISNTNVTATSSATGATGGTLGANSVVGGISGTGTQTVDLATGQTQTINAPQSIAGPGGALTVTLPSSGLYTVNAAPSASYLVVTDPRLTRYGNFISSDYMLGALGLDPSKTIKRLGDGVYEARQVRNQITQLTGRVYLQGYTSHEDEYRALMNSGVRVAQAFNLQPGLALSAAQMAALTSDIVWLVNQTVTLPDGTTQTVLAPVVYLAQTHANDLQPAGALIAADEVEIRATGSAMNAGVIKGGTQTVLAATSILNRGGLIGSSTDTGTTVVSATHDVVNVSGRITGNRVAVLAGHDIVNTTLVDTVGIHSSAGHSQVNQSLPGAQGTMAATGDLVVMAGHDLAVHGASIAAGGNAQIAAGHDITMDTVQSDTSQSVTRNADHHWEASSTMHQTSALTSGGSLALQSGNDTTLSGATLNAGGDITVAAGGNLTATNVTNTATYSNVATDDKTRQQTDRRYDEQTIGTNIRAGGNATLAAVSTDQGKGNITLTGSSLAAGSGAATIAATGDVHISEGREEHDAYSASESKRGSFVHGSTTQTMQDTQANLGVGSTLSGETVTVSAGKNLNVQGSTIAGTHDVNLAAAGNMNLTASQDTQMSSGYNQKHESGFGTGGGIGISVGSKTQTDTANTTQVTHTGSTVGSLGGNLNLSAGKDLHVTGSDLVVAQNLTGTGTNITLDAAVDTQHHDETHEVKQSGFTLALKAPVIDAVSNTIDQAHAASRSQDNRAAALHGMAAASGAMDSSGAAGAALGELASGQMPSARIELSYGSSHSRRTYAEDSTTHRGSKVTAGGTAALVAKGESTPGSGNLTIAGSNVNANDVILAAKNQVSLVNTTDTSSTRSSNESGSASVGISYGTQGFGVSASMSKAHGNGRSDSATQNNTHVSAASTATIISGGDTNIISSNLNGRQVSANVGGNLNMASVQDTMSSAAHQESSGGGFTLSQGGGSASVSHTSANASGNYAGVNEQAGIQAGDGGFDISVKGHTGLNGAYLAGSADASKNTLTTGTLTFSDISNTSNYKASSSGFSAGVSTGDGGANYSTHGNTSGKNTGGGTPMLSQNDSGNDSTTTRSRISAGTISVTDAASQRQDITSLNRDASNTNGTIARLPDVNNLLERQADMMAAASAAGEAVSRRIGDFAQSKYDAAKARGDQAGMEAWKEGGTARAGMQAAGAAMVTGLAGGNAPGSAAGAGIASIAAGKLNEISAAIAGSNPTGSADINTALGNIVANVIATGAGAAVGGNAGAVAGGNVDRFNRQLHLEEKALAKQLADKSGGKYTQAQIEEQLRNMGVSVRGTSESGAPETLIGNQVPADSGAKWIYAGTTADGKPVLTQALVPGDQKLQSYILANYNSASHGEVPSIYEYDRPSSSGWGISVTGPFTQFNKSDADFMRNTTADAAAMVSTNAGRFGAVAGAASTIPSPYAPGLATAAFTATVAGWAAGGVEQLARPNPTEFAVDSTVDLLLFRPAEKYPLWAPAINEAGNFIKRSEWLSKLKTKDGEKK